MKLQAVITCPNCGGRTTQLMPQDQCLVRFHCPNCGHQLKPKPGDCCVFCSYGDVPCPPMQAAQPSCCGGEATPRNT